MKQFELKLELKRVEVLVAGLAGLALGMGIVLLFIYPFTGGLPFVSSGPPDQRYLVGGLLLGFGGPAVYGLYLRQHILGIIVPIVAVILGAVIAFVEAHALDDLFVLGNTHSIILTAILCAIQVIALIKLAIGGVLRRH